MAEMGLGRTIERRCHDVAATVHAHPTLSEVVREAAMAAMGRAIHINLAPSTNVLVVDNGPSGERSCRSPFFVRVEWFQVQCASLCDCFTSPILLGEDQFFRSPPIGGLT